MNTYSFITLRRDIERLGYKSNKNPFLWEETNTCHEQLLSRYPYGRPRKNYINLLSEYCWHVYLKSSTARAALHIGRQHDVWKKEIFDKYALGNGENLWAPHTKGNILAIDKWVGIINDAWLLGGIHRHADFELMSPLAPQNLWNYEAGYHIVTGREVMGLLHFGYCMKKTSNKPYFSCADRQRASNANLISYDALMRKEHLRGPSSITKLLAEPSYGLYQQIHAWRH